MDVIFDLNTVKAATFETCVQRAAVANQEAAKLFTLEAEGWRNVATRNRELGIPIPPKPVPPEVIHIGLDINGWPMQTTGPDVVAPPVPDLPPVSVAPTQIITLVGVSLGGAWYQSMPGDNAPDGFLVQKDGATFKKVVYPFGGWYLKL